MDLSGFLCFADQVHHQIGERPDIIECAHVLHQVGDEYLVVEVRSQSGGMTHEHQIAFHEFPVTVCAFRDPVPVVRNGFAHGGEKIAQQVLLAGKVLVECGLCDVACITDVLNGYSIIASLPKEVQ